jgi:hypothetical protein
MYSYYADFEQNDLGECLLSFTSVFLFEAATIPNLAVRGESRESHILAAVAAICQAESPYIAE